MKISNHLSLRFKIYLTLMTFVFFTHTYGQNTGINFQGVARNANGIILASQKIALKFSIINLTESGAVEYSESRNVNTNAQGIFSIIIGDTGAISSIGNFANVNWKQYPKFLKVEMDPNAGTSFINMGTTQLQKVPYAYYANGVNASNIDGILPLTSGGTGTNSLSSLKSNLGLDLVNNTTDANKPISSLTQTALDLKANINDVNAALTSKANSSDLTAGLGLKVNTADVTNSLALKVDKVTGKDLSSNDFTSIEKAKLAAITGSNTGDQDLSTYATTAATNTALVLKANSADVTNSLALKVDKVTGKDLSSNDFTSAEKTKLAAITGTNTGDQDLSAYATNTALGLKANSADVNSVLALKANIIDVNTALGLKANSSDLTNKENLSNKSTSITLGSSDTYYPTQNAVKTYVDNQISAGGVADYGITNIKIANNAVNTIKLADNSITSAKIVNGSISNAHLNAAAAIDYSKLNLTGSVVASDISNTAAIPFSKLSIVKSDITNLGIPGSDQNTTYTAGNGLTLTGTTFSIGAGAITNTTIADGSVTTAKISDASISTSKIIDANVTTAKIANNSISSAKIIDGSINNLQVNAAAAIDYSKLNLTGSVVASDISNTAAIPFSKLNIVKSDITNLGIPGSDQNTTYAAGNGLTLTGTTFSIGAGAISNTIIADGAVTAAKISDASISTSKIIDANVTTAKIADNSISSAKIIDGTIDNAKINAAAAIDYSKLNLTGSVVASDISNTAAIPFSKLSILKSDITNLGIPGSDQNTTYTAGNGLTLTGTTFSIGAGAITNTTIADDAISTAKVADASITSSKISGAISVSNGGTGLTTLTSNSVLVGNGTNTVNLVAPGTSGNVLKSNGTTWVSGTVSAGATSVGAISSGNNSNGGYISGGVLTLAPAGSGYGGIVINGDQNFSGNKVFNDNVTISNNLSVPYGAISFGNDISVNSVNIGLGHATFINCLSFGNAALASNTSGVYSTALGYYSLQANTTGQGNTATGANSLKANTTGYYNTAMGASSLLVNTTGKWNTAIGNAALGASNGDYNTAIGYQAMNSSSTGSYNTAVGYNSGWSLTSGSKNTSIGYNSLTYDYSNSTVLGAGAAVTGNNQVQLGDYQTTAYAFGSLQNRSDARDKVDVRNTKLGLDFIMSLRPVDYKYNYRDSYRVINADGTETYLPNDGSKTHKDFNHGFIAQEVQSLISEKGFDFGGVNDQNKVGGKDVLYLGYTEFIAPMVKAIQEQQTIIEDQKKRLDALEKLVNQLIQAKQ